MVDISKLTRVYKPTYNWGHHIAMDAISTIPKWWAYGILWHWVSPHKTLQHGKIHQEEFPIQFQKTQVILVESSETFFIFRVPQKNNPKTIVPVYYIYDIYICIYVYQVISPINNW